jgi:hypothetical protein
MAVFWDVAPCNLVEIDRHFKVAYCLKHQRYHPLMMDAVSSSETSVRIYQITRRNIPEDSHLHTRRPVNLKSHHVSHPLQ